MPKFSPEKTKLAMAHVPQLDGIRTIAVMIVSLLMQAWTESCPADLGLRSFFLERIPDHFAAAFGTAVDGRSKSEGILYSARPSGDDPASIYCSRGLGPAGGDGLAYSAP